MLPDNMPQSRREPDEIEPISPEDAAVILQEALAPYLADEWRVIDKSAYAARLTRGMRNLDVRVDLLGEVSVEESNLTPLQESGRLIAWVVLLAMLLVALALATALGVL